MTDYVICYYIHDESNKVIESGFKKGSSAEELENWAKENNIDDYMIYLAMWEVERNYINPLKDITQMANSIVREANSIEYLAKQKGERE